jgi:hypothetical protein
MTDAGPGERPQRDLKSAMVVTGNFPVFEKRLLTVFWQLKGKVPYEV